MHVRPDVVQELIGVQWALSRWNQNPQNANYKLGKFAQEAIMEARTKLDFLALSAFDTCSRGQESLSQTMTFLHETGFFSPRECRATDGANGRIPLGSC